MIQLSGWTASALCIFPSRLAQKQSLPPSADTCRQSAWNFRLFLCVFWSPLHVRPTLTVSSVVTAGLMKKGLWNDSFHLHILKILGWLLWIAFHPLFQKGYIWMFHRRGLKTSTGGLKTSTETSGPRKFFLKPLMFTTYCFLLDPWCTTHTSIPTLPYCFATSCLMFNLLIIIIFCR